MGNELTTSTDMGKGRQTSHPHIQVGKSSQISKTYSLCPHEVMIKKSVQLVIRKETAASV